MAKQTLKSPWPYEGGKTRWSERIWQAFGDTPDIAPSIYLEPFAGSLAVLLGNPNGPAKREVICDTNPGIANFWRSIQCDPDAVARWADYPTIHHDLTARNAWLAKWEVENAQRMKEDADYFDAKAAGWWAWAKSNMIAGMPGYQAEGRSFVRGNHNGGQGISMQRRDNIPFVRGNHNSGQGISMQRRDGIPAVTPTDFANGRGAKAGMRDSIPSVCYKGFINRETQKPEHRGMDATPLDGSRLQPWMRALCERLKGVIVLCRDWQSGLTKPMTMEAYMHKHICAVFLDPPYLTADRSTIYASDHAGDSDAAAIGAYEWAVERGNQERYRIAYACHEGDFPTPDGWTCETMQFTGMQGAERRAKKLDCVMFSPHCFSKRENMDLFA